MRFSKKNEVDMLSGSIVKGLMAIALPIMVMNVLQSLFSIADMTVDGICFPAGRSVLNLPPTGNR